MAVFQPFVLEQWMSIFEQKVDYNLSESGAHPISVRDLLSEVPGGVDSLLDTELGYPHVEGIPALRQRIAALYNSATAENVLVTVGAAEANYITVHTFIEPGDEIVVMVPNYMQVWGIAKNRGAVVKEFHLREDRNWAPDLDELESLVTPQTKMIAVCNPNNPTGYILSEQEMDAIVKIASRVGAWLLADEVYSGAERATDVQTPSFFGRYDKVLAMGSLSKAYGLPGLRIGWVMAPEDQIQALWRRHEYVTISASKLAMGLAAVALSPDVRPRLMARTRGYIRAGYPVLEAWMASHGDTFSLTPPGAAAIAFVKYRLDIGSAEFTDRLCKEKSVLIVPGAHFGVEQHVRISYGLPHDYLLPALDRIHDLVVALQGGAQ